MQYYGIDWLATACGLTGVYLLGNKNKYGFISFMAASLSWLLFGVLTGSIAMSIGSFIFFCLHFRGWLNWNRESRRSTSSGEIRNI